MFACLALASVFLTITPLSAHPISLSTVVANVETNQVKVEMKILVEDLMLFQNLQPNDQQILPADDLRQASQNHHQFLLDYFQVRTVEGTPLSGSVVSTDTEEITDEGIKVDEVMSSSIYYELNYPLTERPDYLTFSQNFGGDSNPLPSVMDLIVLQNSARLGYPVQISPKNPHSTELDWEHPPTNDRKSWRERRELMKQRREELLGITSYSTTYSYIYITETEVRHEILVPLLTLETWLTIERSSPDFLEVDEQDAAALAIKDYFLSHGPVKIDGIAVPPMLDRVDFYGLDFRDFAQRAKKRRVGIHNARAGIILSYSAKQPPSSLEITWDTFNDHTPLLNSVVYDHQDAGYRQFFTPAEPSFTWTRENPISDQAASVELPTPRPQPTRSIPLTGLSGGLIGLALLGTAGIRKSPALGALGAAALLAGIACAHFKVGALELRQPLAEDAIISTQEAEQVISALHSNIYRAFDYGAEEQVYDVLAESVGGELLDSLYLQIKDGLRMEEQGGAIARVTTTEIKEQTIEERAYENGSPVFTSECTWNVSGTVEHWGHIHTRENQYQARLRVHSTGDSWKIVSMDVLNESQVSFQTGLRGTH